MFNSYRMKRKEYDNVRQNANLTPLLKDVNFNKQSTQNNKMLGDKNNDCWTEVKFEGKLPERRGYHSSFIHNQRLFVLGGYDIREG